MASRPFKLFYGALCGPLVVALFLSGSAQAESSANVASFSQSSLSDQTLYEEVFESMGFHSVTPEYELPIPPKINLSIYSLEDAAPEDSFMSESLYTFSVPSDPTYSALEFSLTFEDPSSSDFFYMELIRPGGDTEHYYGLLEFIVEDLTPGDYQFSLQSATPALYKMEATPLLWTLNPEEEEHTLILSPTEAFTEDKWTAINAFWNSDEGNTVVLISNLDFATRFGAYFDRYTLTQGLSAEELDQGLIFLNGETFDVVDSIEIDNGCLTNPLLEINGKSLIQVVQCIRDNGKLSTLYLMSDVVFNAKNPIDLLSPRLVSRSTSALPTLGNFTSLTSSNAAQDASFFWAWIMLCGILGLPLMVIFPHVGRWVLDPALPPHTFGEFLRFFSQSQRPSILSLFFGLVFVGILIAIPMHSELFSYPHGGWAFNALLGLSAATLFLFHLLFPQRIPLLHKLLVKRLERLGENQPQFARKLFWAFAVLSLGLLYTFFLTHSFPIEWLFILLVSGLFLRSFTQVHPIQFTKKDRFPLWILFGLTALIPLVPLVKTLDLFSSWNGASLISLNAVELGNGDLSITSETPETTLVYPQFNPSLLSTTSPLLLQINPNSIPSSTDTLHVTLTLQSSGSVHLKPLGQLDSSADLVFLATLNEYSLVGTWEDFQVYRKKSSPLITLDKAVDSLTALAENSLPEGALVSFELDTQSLDQLSFTHNSTPPDASYESTNYPLSIQSPTMDFYTPLQDDLDLAIQMDSVDEASLYFSLEDVEGHLIQSQKIALSPGNQTLEFNQTGLEPGVYRIALEMDAQEALPTLNSITLNASHLVLWTDELTSLSPQDLYFEYPYEQSLEWSTSTQAVPVASLGGALFSPQGVSLSTPEAMTPIKDELYHLKTPIPTYTLSSPQPLLYSFSESSWFNPFELRVLESGSSLADYIIVENYTAPSDASEEWAVVEKDFSLKDFEDFVLQIDFTGYPNAWILLKTISIDFS